MRCNRRIIVLLPLLSALTLLFSVLFILFQGDCPEGNFTCGSSRLCVLQRSMCDDNIDCPNGEDEDQLFCHDLHGGLTGIMEYVMDNTYMPYNDSCVLDDVPESCSCQEFKGISCNNLNLSVIPSGISDEAEKLVLVNNSLTVLEENVLRNFTSLKLINLAGNKLITIPQRFFHGLEFLRKVILTENQLIHIPTSLVTRPELEWLFVGNNKIESLKLDVWTATSINWIDASKNRISLKNESFPVLDDLQFLYLDSNIIEEITENTFNNLVSLIDLELGWNRIRHVDPNAFKSLTNLRELKMKNNYLIRLDGNLFSMQSALEKLILGGNVDLRITKDLLLPLRRIKSLDLEDIEIPNIGENMFCDLTELDFIYFKRFKYCIFVPHVSKCTPSTDGTSTADDLLGNPLLRSTLWIVSIFTLTTNAVVLWRRLSSLQASSPLNIIITNLSAADFLMGIYLGMIGLEDWRTRGVFRQVATDWASSLPCTFAGIVAMVSCESSILILLLISVERFMLISAPLSGFQSLKKKAAVYSAAAIWAFSLAVSILPVVMWRHSMRFYGINSICFPLHIDEPYLVGWQYSAFVFLGINSFGIIAITVLYIGVFISIWRTRHATTLKFRDSEFALKFFFIVLTNSCCWVPIIILKILALVHVNFSRDVYGWIGVFVLPVNSAINPILYTFTTPNYRRTTIFGSHTQQEIHIVEAKEDFKAINRVLKVIRRAPMPSRTTEELI